MILYRLAHPDYPFLWESDEQPPARWHGQGEGPVHYFATTPEGAWAEIIRHEEITDPDDLEGLRGRAMWVAQLEDHLDQPELPKDVLRGDKDSYPTCQAEARRLRAGGSRGFRVMSAALLRGGALRYTVNGGLRVELIDSEVVVFFGPRPDIAAQLVSIGGRPPARLHIYVWHFNQ